jgi:hypothetical protein
MRALLTSRRRLLHYGLSLTGLSLLPGRVLAAPLHRALPRVGFIKQPPLLDYVDAFLGGMRDLGHVDGESYILDYRYVEQPTAFDLIVNLKAAQAIGLTIPQSVLLQASELLQ